MSTRVKVGGAWATLEFQQEQKKAVIQELCSQLTAVQDSHTQLSIDFEQLQTVHDQLTDKYNEAARELSSVQQELVQSKLDLDTSRFLRQEVETSKEVELSQLEQAVCNCEEAAASSKAAGQVHIRQLEQQVAELRDIIDSSMHTKRASTLKLETAMNALNLSKGDATRFIQLRLNQQELQAVKGKVEQLTAERDKARSESVIVQQQRDCHADHAQLLVKENRRLSAQLQMLRLQQSQPDTAQPSIVSSSQQSKADMQSKPKTAVSQQTQGIAAVLPIKEKSRSKHFDGSDVKNVLHKKPFDLSKGSMQQAKNSSHEVLMQAQQIRVKSCTSSALAAPVVTRNVDAHTCFTQRI